MRKIRNPEKVTKTYQVNAFSSNEKSLPQNFGELVNLIHLDIFRFDNLEEIPKEIENLHKLEILEITNCPNLKSLPENIGNL